MFPRTLWAKINQITSLEIAIIYQMVNRLSAMVWVLSLERKIILSL